ncbi:hypothetical protein [Pelagibius sp. Alg239-R121]|uniref:hypothetical protein n=1 Tax=Pelagibius sp. Alg239-R121 TaxID=2993448 RepID=UPI0024A67B34|nr:hypothetical protein [Pelagibius sp. Alg239-R121]
MASFNFTARAALAFASMALLPVPAGAVIMTFNNEGAFDAAVNGAELVQDPFSKPIPGVLEIVLDSGVVSTNSSNSIIPTHNSVIVSGEAGGFYNNSVSNEFNTLTEFITWTFPMPVIGFGFDLSDASIGDLQVSFDGGNGLEDFIFTDVNFLTTTTGFVGFVADMAYDSFVISNAIPLSTYSFSIDNLVFAKAAPSAAVPLPTTLPLTLFGIGELLWFARARGLPGRDLRASLTERLLKHCDRGKAIGNKTAS